MTPKISEKCPESIVCPECGVQVRVLDTRRTPMRISVGHEVSFVDTEQDGIVDAVIGKCRREK